MTVRPATPDEHLSVMRIVNAAMLETDASEVKERIEEETVLVAEEENRILGTAVLDPRDSGTHIDAIAVLRARRGQGIGRELVETARERLGRLTAEFDPKVRPFYESLGFDIESVEDREERLLGTLEREH
ncbi:Predicted N-acetyltransferase YhbS [Haladaptatus litoreus]|uniref:Predicted N-acetyltransferase YhbS n=1 Tax=Haladaptatus litoreus TaxID=553468 RepID=A0A1N7BPL6_9EURY|nr:GNAT family N-acetyltransferase [Haladaptatus litoreus]SIR53114.1 Predicted N-acetyltransferase YhbS [Haladaptatus litoreus]